MNQNSDKKVEKKTEYQALNKAKKRSSKVKIDYCCLNQFIDVRKGNSLKNISLEKMKNYAINLSKLQ